jgi:hypothetical protein
VNIVLSLMIVGLLIATIVTVYKLVQFARSRGMNLPATTTAVMSTLFATFVAMPAHAQSSAINVNLDLSQFWQGFNQFFNALFPPMAFIASIGAALGFIFLIVNALKTAFTRGST